MANQVKIAEATVSPKGHDDDIVWRRGGEGVGKVGCKLMLLIRLREMKTNFPHHLCFSLSMHIGA